MSSSDADIVIVGGGQAGAELAHTLRASGYAGTVIILEAGELEPYERPPLTKAYLRGEMEFDDLALQPEGFWADRRIELHLGQRVVSVDPEGHRLRTSTGAELGYGTLVWAAGGYARTLPQTDGIDGVMSVRTLADASELRLRAPGVRDVAVLGGGFIGLEAASVLRQIGANVTIIEAMDRLLARVTSPPVSDYFATLHRAHGCDVRLGAAVAGFGQEEGRVRSVELADGDEVATDLLLVGIGLVPHIQPLADAGAVCSNGVDVDEHRRTTLPDVYAIGDCANRVHDYSDGARVRMESVPNAIDQARALGAELAGAPSTPDPVPWFWSHQYDTKLQTAGLFNGHDDYVVRGEPQTGSFSVVYRRREVVIAVDCVNRVRDFAQSKALVAARVRTEAAELADADRPLKALIPAA
jgi:3-phenylpropionate/trans-cinnamate dioxygenase ferredoxin reductase component